MRPPDILTEAFRNVWRGVTSFAVLCALGVTILGGSSFIDARETHELVVQRARYDRLGGSLVVLEASASVSPAACDRLSELRSVISSGAITRLDAPLEVRSLPDQTIPVFAISAGFGGFDALREIRKSDSTSLSFDLARTLGAAAGSHVATSDGTLSVSSIYDWPSDGRPVGPGYAVIERDPTREAFDQCWVQFALGTDQDHGLLASSLTAGAVLNGRQSEIFQFNDSMGRVGPSAESFMARAASAIPWVLSPTGATIAFAIGWSRRLETAAARHAGAGDLDLAFLRSVELLFWITPTIAVAWAGLAAVGSIAGYPMTDALPRSAITFFAGSALGALVAAVLVRERMLFRFFKAR